MGRGRAHTLGASPRGLKPASLLVLGGTAEAVPFPKSPKIYSANLRHTTLVRQIAKFHRQLTVDAHNIHAVVDGMDFHQPNCAGFRLNFLENVSIGVDKDNRLLVRCDESIPLSG